MLNKFKVKKYLPLIIFVLTVLFYSILTQGLPFTLQNGDDLTWIKLGQETSFGTIAKYIFFSQTDVISGGGLNAVDRPVRVLLVKIVITLFGNNPAAFYFMTSLFFGGVALLLFILFKMFTNNDWIAFSCSIFYVVIPGVIKNVIWIAEFDIVAQFFLLTFFILFLRDFSRKQSSWKIQMILFLSGLLAIKTKVTAIIIPFVLFVYVLLLNKRKLKQYILLFSILLLFFIPFGSTGSSSDTLLDNFSIKNIYELGVLNPLGGFGPENELLIFSPTLWLKVVPSSLLSSLGFAIPWFLLLTLMVLFLFYDLKITSLVGKERGILFSGIWLGVILFFYGFSPFRDLRYLTGALIPLSMIVFFLLNKIHKFIEQISGSKKTKKIFQLIIILLFCSTIFVNFYHSTISVRGGVGGRQVGFEGVITTIYNNAYIDGNTGTEMYLEVYGLIQSTKEPNLMNITVSNIRFHQFNKEITLENVQNIIDQYGMVYIVVFYGHPFVEANDPNLLSKIRLCKDSLYCKIKSIIKKEKDTFFVYKIDRSSEIIAHKTQHY
jgi:hypothetical protein